MPAVVHVDGSGRLQTVSDRSNALYAELIRAFEAETGVPIVLNTSFNENEPIVNTPAEALDCFLRTKMDRLVMGRISVVRRLLSLVRGWRDATAVYGATASAPAVGGGIAESPVLGRDPSRLDHFLEGGAPRHCAPGIRRSHRRPPRQDAVGCCWVATGMASLLLYFSDEGARTHPAVGEGRLGARSNKGKSSTVSSFLEAWDSHGFRKPRCGCSGGDVS